MRFIPPGSQQRCKNGRRDTGFGLRGIEERVRELGGSLPLSSVAGKGATLAVRLPLLAEVALARAAG